MREKDNKETHRNKLVTLAEAAQKYGFSPDHLRHLAQQNRLDAQKMGVMWVTTFANVEKYIKSREKKGKFRKDIQC